MPKFAVRKRSQATLIRKYRGIELSFQEFFEMMARDEYGRYQSSWYAESKKIDNLLLNTHTNRGA